jgi:hypothetical protein
MGPFCASRAVFGTAPIQKSLGPVPRGGCLLLVLSSGTQQSDALRHSPVPLLSMSATEACELLVNVLTAPPLPRMTAALG